MSTLSVLGGVLIGLLCGLAPYFLGRDRNRKLAVASLLICAGAGAIGGPVLAVPAMFVTSLITRFSNRRRPPTEQLDPSTGTWSVPPPADHQ